MRSLILIAVLLFSIIISEIYSVSVYKVKHPENFRDQITHIKYQITKNK